MQRKFNFRALLPHLAAILLFLVIAFAYFPDVLEGKRLGGNDNANFLGMAREIADYRNETGNEPLWSNNMFGGMPAYLTSTVYNGNKLKLLDRVMKLGPRPVSFLFLYLIGFYILLISFRVNPWLAIGGALAFAFSSYNFVIIVAGHNAKAIAIAYMAPILAGIVLTFRGKRLLGTAVTGIALSLQLMAGHPQITYYTLIIVVFFMLSQLYYAIREKYFKDLLITGTMLLVAATLSVTSNSARLWTTLEYGKYSMRNPSELTGDEEDKTSGLTKSYATAWSYGIDETFSMLIPAFKGGSSDGRLSERSATYQLFAQGNPAQASEVIKHLPLYWGSQSSTQGNVYVGAIVVFLFVLGMFITDHRVKWWLLAASVLGILLSWGSNFMSLTNFFMEHVPGYNKFRTVSMTLVIPALAMPLLGIIGLNRIFFGEVDRKKLIHALKWSAGVTGGIALLFALFPDLAGNFSSQMDSNYQPALAEALREDRRALLRTDALRSALLIALSAGLILLVIMKKLKVNYAIAALGFLVLIDMWPVDKRYLNNDDFSSKRVASQPFTPSPADQFIMNQPGYNNRVLNLTTSPFQDASTSFFHQSVGGYHGAKMRRYQDLIETGMMEDINALIGALQTQDYQAVDSALYRTNVLNMINTRYIVINPETQPIVNPYAMGNAWFVNRVIPVQNADEEMATLGKIDITREATLDREFQDKLGRATFTEDTTATITLSDYRPDRMVYQSSSSSEQLAVFSEIYYDKGWTAFIDGQESEHLRVDYTLRALLVPPGEHEIVFEFHPRSYYAGTNISMVSSILLLLILVGAVYFQLSEKSPDQKDMMKV